jgi:hypothetical protein
MQERVRRKKLHKIRPLHHAPPAGACLEVTSQVGIPDNFVLVVSYDRIRQTCHVIWPSAVSV